MSMSQTDHEAVGPFSLGYERRNLFCWNMCKSQCGLASKLWRSCLVERRTFLETMRPMATSKIVRCSSVKSSRPLLWYHAQTGVVLHPKRKKYQGPLHYQPKQCTITLLQGKSSNLHKFTIHFHQVWFPQKIYAYNDPLHNGKKPSLVVGCPDAQETGCPTFMQSLQKFHIFAHCEVDGLR